MKNIIILSGITIATLFLASCWMDKSEPNYVYMPNMYYSEAYEPYAKAQRVFDDNPTTVEAFKNGQTALVPPDNTIARNDAGIVTEEYPNTPEAYETSKTINNTPLNPADSLIDLEAGKKAFEINCAVCHGVAGDGQGVLVKNGKINGVPDYKQRTYITEGSIYWVIMNGKGIMGSHASQLNIKERWQVSKYVMKLKNGQ